MNARAMVLMTRKTMSTMLIRRLKIDQRSACQQACRPSDRIATFRSRRLPRLSRTTELRQWPAHWSVHNSTACLQSTSVPTTLKSRARLHCRPQVTQRRLPCRHHLYSPTVLLPCQGCLMPSRVALSEARSSKPSRTCGRIAAAISRHLNTLCELKADI